MSQPSTLLPLIGENYIPSVVTRYHLLLLCFPKTPSCFLLATCDTMVPLSTLIIAGESMLLAILGSFFSPLLDLLGLLTRSEHEKDLEILLMRQQRGMRGEECIAQLQAETPALRAEVKALRKQLARTLVLQPERKRLPRKDSHNSSKLPSADGPTRKRRSPRIPSGRKTGGQWGHPVSTSPLPANQSRGVSG